jgi:hypothetical protein
MNIVEFEGLQDIWDEEESPKLEKRKDCDMDYTNFEMSLALERFYEPDEFLCWQGTRFPQWM